MSSNYNMTAQQILIRAYRLIGALPSGGAPTSEQYSQGIVALNIMLKGWQADQINLFRQKQLQVSVAAGQGSYATPLTLSPLVLAIEEARWVVSQSPTLYERPMNVIAYVDYMQLPNKNIQNQSGPTMLMFDRQATASNIYLWPVPQVSGQLDLTVARTINDVVNSTDTVDVPIEWLEAVVYNLADRLIDDIGMAAADPATTQRINQKALGYYNRMLEFDRPSKVSFTPSKGMHSFGRRMR